MKTYTKNFFTSLFNYFNFELVAMYENTIFIHGSQKNILFSQ